MVDVLDGLHRQVVQRGVVQLDGGRRQQARGLAEHAERGHQQGGGHPQPAQGVVELLAQHEQVAPVGAHRVLDGARAHAVGGLEGVVADVGLDVGAPVRAQRRVRPEEVDVGLGVLVGLAQPRQGRAERGREQLVVVDALGDGQRDAAVDQHEPAEGGGVVVDGQQRGVRPHGVAEQHEVAGLLRVDRRGDVGEVVGVTGQPGRAGQVTRRAAAAQVGRDQGPVVGQGAGHGRPGP